MKSNVQTFIRGWVVAVIVLVALAIGALVGRGISRPAVNIQTENNPIIVLEESRQDGGYITSKTLYDTRTKQTSIYRYTYSRGGWGTSCTGVYVTILDGDNNIIYESHETPSN